MQLLFFPLRILSTFDLLKEKGKLGQDLGPDLGKAKAGRKNSKKSFSVSRGLLSNPEYGGFYCSYKLITTKGGDFSMEKSVYKTKNAASSGFVAMFNCTYFPFFRLCQRNKLSHFLEIIVFKRCFDS